jgi:hypothetical protein
MLTAECRFSLIFVRFAAQAQRVHASMLDENAYLRHFSAI